MESFPPGLLEVFVGHALIGLACLYFGFRVKRGFRWLLLLIGMFELVALPIFFVMALDQYGAQ